MTLGTVLAALVLALPPPATSSRPQVHASASAPGIGDRPLSATDAAAAELGEITSALRSEASRDASERGDAERGSRAGPGKTGDGNAAAPSQAGSALDGESAPTGTSSSGKPTDPVPGATTRATGSGSGREAGDSRADAADVGVSPVLRGTISMQRSAPKARHPSAERQADMDRLGAYDDELPMQAAASLHESPGAAAAATPPTASESTSLSPTESHYVQAWMKASAQRR
jgi:hypothetical protein